MQIVSRSIQWVGLPFLFASLLGASFIAPATERICPKFFQRAARRRIVHIPVRVAYQRLMHISNTEAFQLLERIKPGAQFIIVGDADQLPSVGAGNVLREMIRSEKVPIAVLDTVFRQASNSRIIATVGLRSALQLTA